MKPKVFSNKSKKTIALIKKYYIFSQRLDFDKQ